MMVAFEIAKRVLTCERPYLPVRLRVRATLDACPCAAPDL